MSVKCLLIVPVKMIFPRFVKTELIILAAMAGVMHEADHATLSGAPGECY